jgi:hypothetical protein
VLHQNASAVILFFCILLRLGRLKRYADVLVVDPLSVNITRVSRGKKR